MPPLRASTRARDYTRRRPPSPTRRYDSRRMKFVATAALLFVSLMSVAPVSADVIELRTGERVEGTFPHTFNGPYALCGFSWQAR